ncbi:hypothetical protein AA0313_1875 [Acetobacter indonesiensis NRIC 0313]|uniref:Uncharacterized protein n=1 Tax=Acetobacter indonesiensis TaxID=104101 RepID=A0A6N3T696_9PROT|nr:hypothetical protein Abin_008_023 [Acetobacter indonesiensis]GBQ58717.1 hypothetical protein AA0313_1875 [Acetobacter indonesiensis NRIC 0313]GEN04722.1 hypothetical protein AIN02nite_27470 [Acetobacter indonesiensis]
MRKLADSETRDDLFGFLTTEANREVEAIHPKAMQVILTQPDEIGCVDKRAGSSGFGAQAAAAGRRNCTCC